MPVILPYGAWPSPLGVADVAAGQVTLGQVVLDRGDAFWTEGRPAEGGRSVLVRSNGDGGPADVLPAPWSVRTRVHEYGGRAFALADGILVISHDGDRRLWRIAEGRPPQALTPEGATRFADLAIARQPGVVFAVCEDHAGAGEPANTLVAVDLDGCQGIRTIATGHDFYAAPRVSPDGGRLAWLAWRHPAMPWDGTELWCGTIGEGGAIIDPRRVAGSDGEALVQPEWSPDGVLHVASDRTGWWNLYAVGASGGFRALCPREAEFSGPLWQLGLSLYAFAGRDRVVCAIARRGTCSLGILDRVTGRLDELDLPFTDVTHVAAEAGRAVIVAASPTAGPAVVAIDLATRRPTMVRRPVTVLADAASIARPEALTFPTTDGAVAHAFFYAPANAAYVGPATERPPLIVKTHGGPTAAAATAYDPRVQFWTTRGFAVVDVNYRGSTGYGRAYRDALYGRWGIADVDDCCAAVDHLVAGGRVDRERLVIRGGSAGGYTTLCALTFRNVFRAGASYYGIGDLEALAADTEKFESRYDLRLVGGIAQRRVRSPIHFVDRLACPVILFQGLDDRVVPPNQAETMVAALRAKGLPVEYLAFEGEGHGFRRAETIVRCHEAELAFYRRVLAISGGTT